MIIQQMKNTILLGILFTFIGLTSCKNNSQTSSDNAAGSSNLLSVTDFSDKLTATPDAIILDVRTPSEYNGGHIQHAINADINNPNFANTIGQLDKSKPIFVYCLSGARSRSAVEYLLSQGFSQLYDLEGGMMKWRAAGLPETTEATSEASAAAKGMDKLQFEALVKNDKIVLVDFYADWCQPCKKMEPYLHEISTEMANTVEVVRVNADENPVLMKDLGIDALPTIQVYKQNELAWNHVGFIDKASLVKELK